METFQFDKKQYLKTMIEPMTKITEIITPPSDIWDYAEKLMSFDFLSEKDCKNRYIEAVYSNGDNSYHHVLLSGNRKNIYVVIIIDVSRGNIAGHFVLDLNEEYGLAEN